MKSRPWPLVILALLHFCAPVPNFLVSVWIDNVSIWDAIRSLQINSELFIFFALFPLAGLSIIAMKSWSYPVYLFLTVLILGFSFQQFMLLPEFQIIPVMILGLVYLFNLSLVGYFLLPAVRQVYFDKKVRWWESKPRYAIDIEARLEAPEAQEICTIRELSEGGVLLEAKTHLMKGQKVKLSFSFHKLHFEFEAVVGYYNASKKGYGVIFEEVSKEDEVKLSNLTYALFLLGIEERFRNRNLLEDFQEWFKGLLRDGKGILPEVE